MGFVMKMNVVMSFVYRKKKKKFCQYTGEVIGRSQLSSSEGKVLWQMNQCKHQETARLRLLFCFFK